MLGGALGIATVAAIASLPPGTGHGRPVVLARGVVGSPMFWLALPVAFFGLAWLLYSACSSVSDRLGRPFNAGRHVIQPIGWGLGLPLLSLIVDPWSFSSSAFVLGFTGLALGLLAAWRRYRQIQVDARPEEAQAPAAPTDDEPAPHRVGGTGLIIAGLAVAIPTVLVAMGPSWWPALSGDEPHYLLYARSIWVDGDIDLGADYTEGAYRSYYPPDLPPHTKPGFDPATRYSTHGIGTALLLVPWYAIGSGLSVPHFTLLVRFAMALWLGAFALVLFALLRDIAGARAARRGTLLTVLTGPLIFIAPHLFPDLPALTLSAGAYLILRRRPGIVRAFGAGLLIAALPWLGVKFFALAAALAVVGFVMLWRSESSQHAGSPGDSPGGSYPRLVAFGAPIVAAAAGHVTFTWVLYHRLSPLALYHGGAATGLRPVGQGESLWGYLLDIDGTLQAAIGLLIDQRHGLLMVAPHYLLAVAGFAWLWRRRRGDFWSLLAVFLAHWGAYALSQEMPGWSTSGRPMVGALWTLAIPMGVALASRPSEDRAGTLFAATRAALVAVGVSSTALLLAQPHLLYHDFGVRYCLLLLHYGAPGLPLWKLFPLWVHVEESQWLVSILWLIGWIVLALFLWRWAPAAGPSGSSEDGPAEGGNQASGRRQRLAAYRTAQVVFVLLALLLVLRGILVPVTGLHRPHAYGDLTVWTADSLVEEAWAEPDGIWVRGQAGVMIPVSSSSPIRSIEIEASGLEQMHATVQFGKARGEGLVRPGVPLVLSLDPRAGRAWQGQQFYLLGVEAPAGVSPAELGTDPRDLRLLGLYLRILDVQLAR
jgi:hypothetical protein